MAAANRDIVVEVGATFFKTWFLQNFDKTPFNLSGFTAVAQLRESPEAKYPLASFVCTITDYVGGVIQVVLEAPVTAGLPPGRYIWDLLIVGPRTIRLLKGVAVVEKGATKV